MKTLKETEQAAETESDHTESLKILDESAIEDPNLVAGVEDKLSRLQNLDKLTKGEDLGRLGEKTAVPEEESESSTPESEDGSKPEGDGQAELEEKSDGSTPEVEKKGGDVEIPDAYIRAAVHQGWDEEVVDDLVKTNPELAKKALENLYLSTNNASREWSALGRVKLEQDHQQTTQTATEVVAQEDPGTVSLIAKLRKEYPDDPLIDVVIAGLEKKVKPQPVQQQPVQGQKQYYETATAHANAAANAATDQRINIFFSADNMSPYEKFYGKLELGQIPEDLTNGQQQNRLAVLEETECIIAGHSIRGQKIELEQALEKAHFVVTEPIRQQVIRDNLKATATKRKKSMTLKPSDSKRSGDSMRTESSKPRNRRELELAVGQKLDSVFKK